MITIIDGFSPVVDQVRASALAAGFNTWKPNSAEVGSGVYSGMGYMGNHADMVHALSYHLGNRSIFPQAMFFRISLPGDEPAYIHSDREMAPWTCVVYLSEHPGERYGTSFYYHRASGLYEMPSFEEMRQSPATFEMMKISFFSIIASVKH